MTPTEAAIAESVINYLSEQTYQGDPILHAIVCCDHVSRQRMVSALAPVIKPLIVDAEEAKAISCVCINAFKALQMAAENKIDEKTFVSVIESSAIEMGHAADWLKAYTDTLIDQVNALIAERNALLAENAALREALGKLNKRLSCEKHTKLRHPMCGDCQALAIAEAALTQPATDAALERVQREAAAEALEEIAKNKGIDGGRAYFAKVVYREFPDLLHEQVGVVEAADLMARAAALRGGQ